MTDKIRVFVNEREFEVFCTDEVYFAPVRYDSRAAVKARIKTEALTASRISAPERILRLLHTAKL